MTKEIKRSICRRISHSQPKISLLTAIALGEKNCTRSTRKKDGAAIEFGLIEKRQREFLLCTTDYWITMQNLQLSYSDIVIGIVKITENLLIGLYTNILTDSIYYYCCCCCCCYFRYYYYYYFRLEIDV